MKILMLHGINHNMFGRRDPKQYGTVTLPDIDAQLVALGRELGVEIESFVDRRGLGGELGRELRRQLAFLKAFDVDLDAGGFFKLRNGRLQKFAVGVVGEQHAELLALSKSARSKAERGKTDH